MNTCYKLLAIENLQPGRYQPRVYFDEKSLQELADSIINQGLIEPLVVREVAVNCYEIIAGERRWRAALMAGLTAIPCLIGHFTDEQAATTTLVENIQRQELNLIEEASGYRRLCDEFNFQQDEIAILVSKSRSHIANVLRLLTLCSEVQKKICTGVLTFGHARALVGMQANLQISLAKQVIDNEWSVRTLEEKVKTLKTVTISAQPSQKDKDIQHLEVILAEQIGAPVQIISESGKGGWLQVKFYDNDTLAGLLERMGLRYD